MLTVRVNTTGLDVAVVQIRLAEVAFARDIPVAVNGAGDNMRKAALDELQLRYPDIPRGQLSDAITTVLATPMFPSYRLMSNDIRLPYVRWITMRDEKVCKICGPRDNIVYREREIAGKFPAHPHCRCRLERIPLSQTLVDLAAKILPPAQEDGAVKILDAFTKEWGASRTIISR